MQRIDKSYIFVSSEKENKVVPHRNREHETRKGNIKK